MHPYATILKYEKKNLKSESASESAIWKCYYIFYLWFLESKKKRKLLIFLLYFEGLQYIYIVFYHFWLQIYYSILIDYKAKNLNHWLLEFMSFHIFISKEFPYNAYLEHLSWSIFLIYRYIFTVWYKLETFHLKVKYVTYLMPKFYGHCSKPSWAKGHQSEPPTQNLAKMTLNKLDYSNYVQWNLGSLSP